MRRIRLGLIHDQVNPNYTVIDSFPMLLCQRDRNFRAKLMSKHASRGYISSNLKHELQLKDINLETLNRSNMRPQSKFEKEIIKHRPRVETTFSQLNSEFNVEHNPGRTTKDYQTSFEQCLLVDTYNKLN